MTHDTRQVFLQSENVFELGGIIIEVEACKLLCKISVLVSVCWTTIVIKILLGKIASLE